MPNRAKRTTAVQLAPTPTHVAIALSSWENELGLHVFRGGMAAMAASLRMRRFVRALDSSPATSRQDELAALGWQGSTAGGRNSGTTPIVSMPDSDNRNGSG